MPAEVLQGRLHWLSRYLRVDVVEGGAVPARVKGVLDGGLSSEDSWIVVQRELRFFMAVSRREEEAAAWAKADYAVAEGALVCLR